MIIIYNEMQHNKLQTLSQNMLKKVKPNERLSRNEKKLAPKRANNGDRRQIETRL